jgi:methanogenic corrinoid protein MtbC1
MRIVLERPRSFAASLVDASRGAFAADAARRMIERDPELARRWAPRPFERWRDSLDARLRDLVAALDADDPQVFVDQVRWARIAFEARAVPLEDLRAALGALSDALGAELPGQAWKKAEACLHPALASLSGPAGKPPEHLDGGSEAGRLAARYLAHIVATRRREAYDVVLDALRAGAIDARTALVDVLAPVVRQLGLLWHTGELGVADEHLGTAASRALAERILALSERAPENGKRVLAAVVAGDAHDFGLSLVSLLFELDGWRVLHLGADVPAGEIAALAKRAAPDLVLLSATLPWQRQSASRAIELLRETHPAPILVGGAAFAGEDAARTAGADGWAGDAREALRRGRELVGLPPA